MRGEREKDEVVHDNNYLKSSNNDDDNNELLNNSNTFKNNKATTIRTLTPIIIIRIIITSLGSKTLRFAILLEVQLTGNIAFTSMQKAVFFHRAHSMRKMFGLWRGGFLICIF